MKEATRVDQGKKTRGVVQVRSVEPRSIVNPACPACAVRAAAKIFVFCPRNQHVPICPQMGICHVSYGPGAILGQIWKKPNRIFFDKGRIYGRKRLSDPIWRSDSWVSRFEKGKYRPRRQPTVNGCARYVSSYDMSA